MLPRTARAGLISRRYFHHSSTLLAKTKTSPIRQPSILSLTSSNKKQLDAKKPATKAAPIQPIQPSAQKIANDALSLFFLSRPPSAASNKKVKAANTRQFGTLSFQRHILLSADKKDQPENRNENPARPDVEEKEPKQVDEEESNKQAEKQKKDDATDKAEETPKDEPEVSCSGLI